jgi:hypothetical protein
MGHYCRICGRVRANEAFTGKGHRIHRCKDCQRLPKAEIEKIEIEEELFGFLKQSRISPKNQKRLESLGEHPDPEIKVLAGLLLRVSKTVEGKRRRWKRLREQEEVLYQECLQAGLIETPDWEDEIPR